MFQRIAASSVGLICHPEGHHRPKGFVLRRQRGRYEVCIRDSEKIGELTRAERRRGEGFVLRRAFLAAIQQQQHQQRQRPVAAVVVAAAAAGEGDCMELELELVV